MRTKKETDGQPYIYFKGKRKTSENVRDKDKTHNSVIDIPASQLASIDKIPAVANWPSENETLDLTR